jgi:Ca2+-binding EF-hand superfamily protein
VGCREMWLAACKRVFADLDSNNDNALKSEDLVKHLREKLPQTEIDCAVESVMQASGYAGNPSC